MTEDPRLMAGYQNMKQLPPSLAAQLQNQKSMPELYGELLAAARGMFPDNSGGPDSNRLRKAIDAIDMVLNKMAKECEKEMQGG